MSCIHIYGGIMPLSDNRMATVSPNMFLHDGSCYHYFGGIIPLPASHMATVSLRLFLIVGS